MSSTENLDTYAGSLGDLPADNSESPSAPPLSLETLVSHNFTFEADAEKLHAPGPWRVVDPSAATRATVPRVCASVELYGAVAGWRLLERLPTASAVSDDADAEDARAAGVSGGADVTDGSGGVQGGEGAAPRAAASAAVSKEVPLRDRNTYKPFRWMFSALHDRAAAIEEAVEDMSVAIAGGAGIGIDAVSMGRICAEADAAKVNAASISLELVGGAGRLSLDFREVPKFAVFPGQVVGVKGAMTSADRMMVTSLLTDGRAPYAMSPASNAAAVAAARRATRAPTRVWVASGPFTQPVDFNFDPLHELLAEIVESDAFARPDVLVLTGPFVDADHKLAKDTTGTVEGNPNTFREIFSQFMEIIKTYMSQASASSLEVVLMPSPADAHLDNVFPQWPIQRDFILSDYAEDSPDVLQRITLLPNPATWVCGDLVWGATSVDTLFHLNAEEASRSLPGERPDRVAALATHVLNQRSYYPLYPAAPPEAPGGGVPLELPQLWHVGMSCAPDVLILPSRIGKPCVRILGGTVVVNPGSLGRSKSFARLAIYPHKEGAIKKPGDAEYDAWVFNDAPSRVRVDVNKLVKAT